MTREIMTQALDLADDFMRQANSVTEAKEAADWALAAKNAMSVALLDAQIEKTLMSPALPRNERR